jgi:predicted RNA-binding Zn ribbon-like protein
MSQPHRSQANHHRAAETIPSRAGSLHLIGGAPCLDFANTASGRGTAAHQEHLRSYDDLLIWSAHGGGLPADARRTLVRRAAETPQDADKVLQRAHHLREAIRDVVVSIAQRTTPDPAQAELVAREAAAAVSAAGLTRQGQGVRWRWPDRTDDLARPLWPIARSAFELIEDADPARLKLCPAADCGWIFLDRSKNNSRRWCDMRVCGNREKVRRFYERSGD